MNYDEGHQDYTEGYTMVTIYLTEIEDPPLIKRLLRECKMGFVLDQRDEKSGIEMDLMISSMTQLYLLGRFVGVERKRIHDLDF